MEPQRVTKEMSDRMDFLQREIEKALAPYRENTEAALAVAALMRCARKLIDLYPPAKRDELVMLTIAFLKRQDLQLEEEQNTLVLPPWLTLQ